MNLLALELVALDKGPAWLSARPKDHIRSGRKRLPRIIGVVAAVGERPID